MTRTSGSPQDTGTVRTGQGAWRTIRAAVAPSTVASQKVLCRVASTTRSLPSGGREDLLGRIAAADHLLEGAASLAGSSGIHARAVGAVLRTRPPAPAFPVTCSTSQSGVEFRPPAGGEVRARPGGVAQVHGAEDATDLGRAERSAPVRPLTTSTGRSVRRNTFSVTDPSMIRSNPLWPWEPMTTSPACRSRATRTIAGTARSSSTSSSALGTPEGTGVAPGAARVSRAACRDLPSSSSRESIWPAVKWGGGRNRSAYEGDQRASRPPGQLSGPAQGVGRGPR